MIVLVTGGRNFGAPHEKAMMFDVISHIHITYGIECIVHGDARGADTVADEIAKLMHIDRVIFPANWDKHGKAAGPIRNRSMLDRIKVDLVLAMPGGNGTADMVKQATKRNVDVIYAETLHQEIQKG